MYEYMFHDGFCFVSYGLLHIVNVNARVYAKLSMLVGRAGATIQKAVPNSPKLYTYNLDCRKRVTLSPFYFLKKCCLITCFSKSGIQFTLSKLHPKPNVLIHWIKLKMHFNNAMSLLDMLNKPSQIDWF